MKNYSRDTTTLSGLVKTLCFGNTNSVSPKLVTSLLHPEYHQTLAKLDQLPTHHPTSPSSEVHTIT